ncbi:MAG TPA: methionyl-tRNA formyltransferase [Clostridia bacterium]|nr:methionyl-tRNA formyltransferase [Clostridia bacterium]
MLVFFGTSPNSAQFLELAQKNGLKVKLVVSAPPKPVGRKRVLTENPTITQAKTIGLDYLEELKEIFSLPKPKIGIILDFNRLIPRSIIDHFEKGIVNIHFSRLPQYRGPAPVQATILNGDKEAWISYFLITEKLDEGPILSQTSLALNFTETSESLCQKLIQKAAQESPQIITDYLAGKITPRPQKAQPSYTSKLTSSKAKIDWQKPAEEIEKLIRAAYPEPGAWTTIELRTQKSEVKTLRLKILKAHLENKKLVLDKVQLEGKKPVTWKQFKEGYPKASCSFLSFL